MSNIKQIPVSISAQNGVPVIKSNVKNTTVGARYDHEQQRLVFTRPSEWATFDLILFLRDFDGNVWRVNRGSENDYLIPNAMTQTEQLSLQVAFIRGDEYRAGTNVLIFNYSESFQNGQTPEPVPDIVSELEQAAFTRGVYDAGREGFVFYNLAGDEVDFIEFMGGGGGGDVTKRYVDEHDAATLTAATQYTDNTALGKEYMTITVMNVTGRTQPKGTPIMINSEDGVIKFDVSMASNPSTSFVDYFLLDDLPNGESGTAVTRYMLEYDTSMWAEFDTLYVGSVGGITNSPEGVPFVIPVGFVVTSAVDGLISIDKSTPRDDFPFVHSDRDEFVVRLSVPFDMRGNKVMGVAPATELDDAVNLEQLNTKAGLDIAYSDIKPKNSF